MRVVQLSALCSLNSESCQSATGPDGVRMRMAVFPISRRKAVGSLISIYQEVARWEQTPRRIGGNGSNATCTHPQSACTILPAGSMAIVTRFSRKSCVTASPGAIRRISSAPVTFLT